MGILLIAGQLRTTDRFFHPDTSSWIWIIVILGDEKARERQPRLTTRSVVYLPVGWLPFADAMYEQ